MQVERLKQHREWHKWDSMCSEACHLQQTCTPFTSDHSTHRPTRRPNNFNTLSLQEVVYHACTGTPLYQTANDNLKCKTSPLKFIIGAKFINGLRDPDQAREGVVCHPKTKWYILPACKIWQLSFRPFWRYDCERWNWKCLRDPDYANFVVVCYPKA